MQASDGRTPPRTANTTVVLTVVQDNATPAFVGLPYNDASLSESTPVGTQFYMRVQATTTALEVGTRNKHSYIVVFIFARDM